MDLEKLYHKVKETVDSLDFERIWPEFRPLKFARYDSETCFFDGRFVEKTDAFCANTSICYQGEQIAIWMVAEETELPVLTSKIVHEMFHGFQAVQGWNCWPNELDALYRYEYGAENLCLKLRENELLLKLLRRFDETDFQELLSLRKLRSIRNPFEFSYESMVEEIEGAANYVEWQVLKQLDRESASMLERRMHQVLAKTDNLFPVRISCYETGALMIHALLLAGRYPFESRERPVITSVLKDTEPSGGDFPGKEELFEKAAASVGTFQEESEMIVRSAVEMNEVIRKGPLELVSANIYDARYWKGYLISTYFLMYRDGKADRLIEGDFVIRMKDAKTIETVYRWKRN